MNELDLIVGSTVAFIVLIISVIDLYKVTHTEWGFLHVEI